MEENADGATFNINVDNKGETITNSFVKTTLGTLNHSSLSPGDNAIEVTKTGGQEATVTFGVTTSGGEATSSVTFGEAAVLEQQPIKNLKMEQVSVEDVGGGNAQATYSYDYDIIESDAKHAATKVTSVGLYNFYNNGDYDTSTS